MRITPHPLRRRRAATRPGVASTRFGAAVVVTGAVVALGACGGSAHTSTTAATVTGPVVARTGSLEIIHPYLPDPASPSVAAVYLTVRNVGSSADTLLSVSSPVAATAMLMTEDDAGSTGTMARLEDVPIPARGEASLVPGRDHAMLENPTTTFTVGQHVAVTLRFERAAPVTVQVPVVPITALITNDGQPVPTTTMTKGMKGMNMGSAVQP